MTLAILAGLVLVVAQTESSSAPLAVQYTGQGRVERLQRLLEADPKVVAVADKVDGPRCMRPRRVVM